MIAASYLIETALDPARVAATMAGEQSSGTFVRLAGETDELRSRAGADVLSVEEIEPAAAPTLSSSWLERKAVRGPWRRARVILGYPEANVGANLSTLAATVAGNLYDLGELTGIRLVDLGLTRNYRARYAMPAAGIAGTRRAIGVVDRPLLGTIIKPNVGLSADDTADLVATLCEAGVDFLKDDEICANPDHAPFTARVSAVMDRVRRYRDRTGREVMVAFNVTDGIDQMRRNAEHVEREGGNCVMASLNWCGLSGMEALRAMTPLAIHGHRNGFGALSRHPMLGIGFAAYQKLYRLAGIDHLHVGGIGGKFSDRPEDVADDARKCVSNIVADGLGDAILPVFSSGQWAGTLPETGAATNSPDFIFLAGGGILAHPGGPAAGVTSLIQAWEAVVRGVTLADHAADHAALAAALGFFGPKTQ